MSISAAPSGWTRVVILLFFLSIDMYRDLFTAEVGQHPHEHQLSARNVNFEEHAMLQPAVEEEEGNSSMCTWVYLDSIS